MVLYAQGGSREVWGRKGAAQGSQMDPLDGPIAGLVEGDTFIQHPVGQKKSAKRASKLNQRRGWPEGMPKGPWGPRGPWAEPLRQCIPLRCMGAHHNAHARRSGRAAAEPAILAQ